MGEIIRTRTIRPSSRNSSSSYKVKTSDVGRGDVLKVNIDHENGNFNKSYKFNGMELAGRDSIYFKVRESSGKILIEWSGVEPSKTVESQKVEKRPNFFKTNPSKEDAIKQEHSGIKNSFPPISFDDTEVLIFGTLPGEKSLLLQEYYAHPRNKFWKILSSITNEPLPSNYKEKQNLLLKTKVGIWDIAHSSYRKGSLDSSIQNEVPNDLPGFIKKHPHLNTIAFNGSKAESLFDKYFERSKDITYVSLPSSSPANTGFTFEAIFKRWEKILN